MKTLLNFIVAILVTSSLSFGQDLSKKIDAILKDHLQKNPDVGISVGFIKNNQEYYTAYGKLAAESEVEINKNTVFEIASITKILTSNLIAQAAIENKLKLGDFIDPYLPSAYALPKNLKNRIKISDLASHQSGLCDLDFRALIALNPQQPVSSVTEETLAGMINNCSLLADYGQYRYSTIGYTLLGQILENVYDKSYDEILRDKLIRPLQLTNTMTKNFDVENKTTGHNPDGGIQAFFDWNIVAPAGLVKSSASDMVTFLKAILNKENAISDAALIAEKIFYDDGKRAVGLGLNIITDDKNTIYLKSGDSMGQSSIICYNRTENWGIIILLDQRNSKLRQNLLNEIYETVLK